MKLSLRIFLILMILFPLVVKCYSNKYQDSLRTRLAATHKGDEKSQLLNDLSRSYFDKDYTKSIQIARQGLSIARKENYEDGIIDAYRIIGYCYFQLGNYVKSLESYFCATSYFKNIKDKSKLIKTYQTIAYIYNTAGNPKLAIRYNDIASKLLKDSENKERLSIGLATYAKSYFILKNFEKTIAYAKESIASGDSTNLLDAGTTNNQLGLAFWYLKQYDSALKYYNRHLLLSARSNDSVGIAMAISNIGTTYYSKGDYNKAISFYDKSIALNQSTIRGHTYLEYVDSYLKLNNIERATYFFNLAKNEPIIDLKDLSDGCKSLVNFFKQKDLANKALYYSEISDSIKDVITKRVEANRLEMQAKVMEFANAELLRENLKQEKENTALQKRYNYLSIFVIILLSALTLPTMRYFYLKRERKIKESNKDAMIKLEKQLNVFDEISKMNEELEEEKKQKKRSESNKT